MAANPDSFNVGPFQVSSRPSASEFADKLNRLREAVESVKLNNGVGYFVTRTRGGTTIQIDPKGPLAPEETIYPFKTIYKNIDGKYEFYVYPGMVGNNNEINGLGRWISMEAPGHVVLEADISESGELRNKSITSIKLEDEVNLVDASEFRQTKARIIIATIYLSGPVVQNVRTHLITQFKCFNGVPALYLLQQMVGE